MKNKQQIPTDINSTFVNVTLSAKPIDGKYPLYDLKQASKGWWVMTEETASKIKWVFPVRRNKVLGVFEVEGYECAPDITTGNNRVNFRLKNIYEGSTAMINEAIEEINSTHFVTKYFKINI
jgi:hypothetical protein